MQTEETKAPGGAPLRESEDLGLILSLLDAAKGRELERMAAAKADDAALAAFRDICSEIVEYNASLELLVNGAKFLVKDVSALARSRGMALSGAFLADMAAVAESLSGPEWSGYIRNAVPRKLHPATLEILEIPQLSLSYYHLLNNYILQRTEHKDITDFIAKSETTIMRYPILREVRTLLPFYTILFVNHYQIESQPAIQGIAASLGRLFGKAIEETLLHRKMVLAASIYRADIEFQQGMEMFNSAESLCSRIFSEAGLGPDNPARRMAFDLLGADRREGLASVCALIDALVLKAPEYAEDLSEAKRDLEIGSHLMDKALAHYRGFLSDPERRKVLAPSLIRIIAMKILTGSDFINEARFSQDIVQGFKRGEYDEHLFGTVLNALTTLQSSFVRFDSFNERRTDLERSTQNRELALAKEFRDILTSVADASLPPLPPPVLAVVIFYYRFLLGLLFRDRPRLHILRSQIDLITDAPSTPNDFGFFRRVKSSAVQDFVPVLAAFDRLASPYRVSAQSLLDASDPEKNPQIVAHLQTWLFSQHVKKTTDIV